MLSAPAQNGKIEHPNLTFVVAGTSSTIYFTIPALARSLGYFKDEGLNVEWIDLGSGAKGLQALVGGSADVVTGSYEHTIHMQAKGVSIISIAAHNESTGNAMGVSKAKAAAMKNGVPDLKGAIVGISGPGSSTDMFAKIVVENTGIKRDDVSYIAIGTSSAAVAALRGGKVDAVSNVDPVISELVNSGDMILIADGRSRGGRQEGLRRHFRRGLHVRDRRISRQESQYRAGDRKCNRDGPSSGFAPPIRTRLSQLSRRNIRQRIRRYTSSRCCQT